MKPYYCVFIIFLLFVSLLVSSSASARLLATKQGEKEAVTNEISQAGSSTKIREAAFTDLMGSEECDEKDEECLKRRMIAEAHLDYIYTQHHKP